MGEVCVLPNQFISSSKGTCLSSIYIILPFSSKSDKNFLRLIYKHSHRDTKTDRRIHADENNTCSKTKFLGQVIRKKKTYGYFILGEVKCTLLYIKGGGPGMCSTEHTTF